MLYHCDYHDDEMPYLLKVGDKVLIEFPHQYTINDHRMLEHVTRQEFFEKFQDEFGVELGSPIAPHHFGLVENWEEHLRGDDDRSDSRLLN